MSQDEPIDATAHGSDHVMATGERTDPFGERIVLNATAGDANAELSQRYADAVLEVLAGAKGLGRAEVSERVESALDRLGRDSHTVEIAELTDKILRGARTNLTIQTDDGVVLGRFDGGHEAGGPPR